MDNRGESRGSLPCIAAAVVALLMASAAPGHAFTLIGQPDFLSPGQVWSLPFTFLGEQVTPRLDVDGFFRVQAVDNQLNNKNVAEIVPEVDLDVNLQITATQRIHALFQPIDGGFQKPTAYTIYPGGGWNLRTTRPGGEPAAIWYEGEPLNWLSPNDRYPLDFYLAAGRFPLTLQNGIFFSNIMDGFAISHDDLQFGTLSNLNVIYFLSIGQTQGGLTAVTEREQRKQLMGGEFDGDWYDYYFEGDVAAAYGNGQSLEYPQDRDRYFWAFSVTRVFRDTAVALRVLGSTPNYTLGGGELFVLETGTKIWGTRPYVNIIGGLSNWMPVSQLGSAFANEGILWTFDRLTPFPGLSPTGANKVGAVSGITFNPAGAVQFTPEIGGQKDNAAFGANDQAGAGFQIQADMSRIIKPGNSLRDLITRGLFYGTLLRFTFVGIRNQNTQVSGERFDYGERLETIYQF
ncbi:MAG TPA: hypothetical protein VNF29_00235 [Candidatus Binataceae bacterium]|nr:hypothetical protein [Candidatus Binataceae bacterium]